MAGNDQRESKDPADDLPGSDPRPRERSRRPRRVLPDGPTTGATPIISPLLASQLQPGLMNVPPSKFHLRVAALLARAPTPLVKFVLRWWAVISGRRVPGLAAEAAFWVVFSLPWLLLAFVTGLGFVSQYVGESAVHDVEQLIYAAVSQVLTRDAAEKFALPVLNEIFTAGRPDLGLIGAAFALWSGSRAVTTYVDAIGIINGEFGRRTYMRRRGLSVLIYLIGALMAVIVVPVVIAGPKAIGASLGLSTQVVTIIVFVLGFAVALLMLSSLFHFASYRKKRWRTTLPGATLSVLACGGAAVLLTIYVRGLFSESSVYGVLATPIAVMIFALVMSFIALAGAAFNAVLTRRPIFQFEPDSGPPRAAE